MLHAPSLSFISVHVSQTLYSKINEDRNWGAALVALVVRVLAISIALICNTALH